MPGERKRALKILLLSNKVPYPARDGSSIAIKMMIDGLLANNAEVSLLCLNTLKHYKEPQHIAAEKPESLRLEVVKANTNIHPLGALSNLVSGQPYHVSRFAVPAFRQKLIEMLQEHQYDVVQLEGLTMGVYLPVIRQYSGAKVSLRAHNVEYLIWERHLQSLHDYFRKQYLKIQVNRLKNFEKEVVSNVDLMVPITPVDDDHFRSFRSDYTGTVIPCGINPDELHPASIEPEFDIVYLASFDWPPNVQGLEWFLSRVWPLVLEKYPDTTFALGGRHLPNSILNMNIPGFKIIGPVASMPEFIAKGKVVIVPLLAGSGMRIKIVENMAMGKAMVSTTVGAEGIELKDGENIQLADEPLKFAEAIGSLLSDPDLRHRMEKEARANAERHYNTFKLGSELLDFYRAAL